MTEAFAVDKRITAQDVAQLLQIKVGTVYKWAREGRIPCHKFRHRMRFSMRDIERWIAQHTTGKF